MRVIVPFDAHTPKTRLGPLLSSSERQGFATALLDDVITAVQATGHTPEILATDTLPRDTPLIVDEQPLTPAVNALLSQATEPVAVVMADLGLVTPRALDRLLTRQGETVLVPGQRGGTNAFLARHPAFRVDYHGTSIRDHREIATEIGGTVTEIDSFRLGTDIDEPSDLIEVLLHTDGHAATWLQDHGFTLTADNGTATLRRHGTPVLKDE